MIGIKTPEILLACGVLLSSACMAAVVPARTNFITVVPTNSYIVVDARTGNGTIATGFSFDPVLGNLAPFDILTTRYNGRGRALWTNVLEDFPGPVTQDITRNRRELLVLTSTSLLPPASSRTILRRMTTKGQLLWTKTFDFGDAAYICQAQDGSVLLPTATGLLVKLNENGEGLWTNRFGNYIGGVDTDLTGNVYAGAVADSHLVIAKFASNGSLVWSNQLVAAFVRGGMAVDADGNAYVAVESELIKFSAAGVPVWTNSLTSSNVSFVTPTDVALDRRGDVHVTGWYTGGGQFEVVSAKVTSGGEQVWLQTKALSPGTGGDLTSPAHFTRVQPSHVTIKQHNKPYDDDRVYTFTTHTVRFRAP